MSLIITSSPPAPEGGSTIIKMNRKILALALPAIVSNITVPLLSLVDITIVGHMGNAVYLGAISLGAMIFNVMYWLFGFLRMGGSGMTAQAVGANDNHSIRIILARTLLLGCGIGMFMILLMWPLRELSLFLMQVGNDTMPAVVSYFNICIFGAPAVLGSFALNGWLIGMQNTRIPMRVAIVQNIINILLSVSFVYALGMMIEGVALGTMLSQWIAFIVLYIHAKRLEKKEISVKDKSVLLFRELFIKRELISFFKINRDIFLRTVCLVAVNLYFTSAGSAQGTMILAANTVLMTFFTLFSYIMDGFAHAGEALGGKYYGEKNPVELFRLECLMLRWGVLMTVVFTLVYFFGGNILISMLTDEVEVVKTLESYKYWTLLIPISGMMAFIYDGLYIGMTRTRLMLLSCAVGATLFFAVYFSLRSHLGNHALWLALVVYLASRGLVLMYRFRHISVHS